MTFAVVNIPVCNCLPCLGAKISAKIAIFQPVRSFVKGVAEAALFRVQLMRRKVSISSPRYWFRHCQQDKCTCVKYYCRSAIFFFK